MTIINMADLDLAHKRVLIRQDLNVPVRDGKVTSDSRIRAAIPTLKHALDAGARVMLMSHLGRPKTAQFDPALSLQPIADCLSTLMEREVKLVRNWLDGVTIEDGELVLCENVRFNQGETANDDMLARRMAKLCDVFVMDAFGTVHRAQASTQGVARFAPVACAGPLLAGELAALERVLENPARPLVAIVGGSKVSTKLMVLESLSHKMDQLIVGGGIANTFIAAAGYPVGKSLYETDLVYAARQMMSAARERGADIPLPVDVVVGDEFSATTQARIKPLEEVTGNEMIFDIGPRSAEKFANLLKNAGTIIWNGPVGVFEFDQFGEGTRILAQAVADSEAFSIAGGGDTLAAVSKYDVTDHVSYISTGGGAFLELLEGKSLPGLTVLKQRAASA